MRVTILFCVVVVLECHRLQIISLVSYTKNLCSVEKALTIFNFGDKIVNKCIVPKRWTSASSAVSTLLKNLGQLLVHNPPFTEKGLSNDIEIKRMRATKESNIFFFYLKDYPNVTFGYSVTNLKVQISTKKLPTSPFQQLP